METGKSSKPIEQSEIHFENDHSARVVTPAADAKAEDILKALDITPPKAVVVVIGGADHLEDSQKPRLTQLFSRGIANAALDANAMIVDGGTHSGVMALMGQGVADRGGETVLLGVAPRGKVSYPGAEGGKAAEDTALLEPHHTHFVLVDSREWGGETETMFQLIKALAKAVPAIAVLVGGGAIAKDELLRCVRQKLPVLIIEGSGGVADEAAGLCKKKSPHIDDPAMAEIITDGDLHRFPAGGTIPALRQVIQRLLGGNATLRLAWEQFALYDWNAIRQQKSFIRMQYGILVLAVAGTFLALAQTQLQILNLLTIPWQDKVFQYVIILIPITVSVIMSVANRFKAGNKWILLRAAAEAIKQEIFQYRTRTGIFNEKNTQQDTAEYKLARRIKSITGPMMQTEVNLAGLRDYEGPIPPRFYGTAENDNGMSFLSPGQYVSYRLQDQLDYYRSKTQALEKKLRRFQWYIYIAGGAGTLLAAVGFELWIAFTTALAGALTTYLEFRQIENSLVSFNQAATDLANIKAWWTSLPAEDQTNPRNVDKLVEYTENSLQRQNTGWIQQMQDMLEALHDEQAAELAEASENG